MEQKENSGYYKLDIYKFAHELAIKVHAFTMNLPKYELFEEGSQVRRSSKSVSSNIVEGYALRKYKNEYLHYLYRAHASAEETIEHIRLIVETQSIKDTRFCEELLNNYRQLSSKIFNFIRSVESQHGTPFFLKEDSEIYPSKDIHET